MSEPERREQEPDASEGGVDTTAAYASSAVGVALLIGAILLIISTGTPVAGMGLIIGGAACLGWGIPQVLKHKNSLPGPVSKERELLSAIRDNGGSITPAEAAMETSLTVREADEMLSELTSGGHLRLESQSGSLHYSLPTRREQELGG
ncbi:hypothetical protein [Rubrobacter aplysinae]|uniref:hypothetical protein n=1 Tax=Rubrobacter aplysinae TaxID=909625 RepID=UPI00064BCD9C|nr:hypothetical protein [Rubrobacter aplysinae]